MSLVSIIVPVYNVEKYLDKCLKNLVNQTYSNIEIIIIDDCSTDNSYNIIKKYEKYKNIKIIHNKENLGISAARNIGLKQAQGDYILFVDSDDWVEKDAVDKLYNLINKFQTNIAIGESIDIFGIYKRGKNPKIIIDKLDDLRVNPNLISNEIGVVWNKLYKHDFLNNTSFPEGLVYEDIPFIYPLLFKAEKVAKTNEVLYYYKRHISSLTISNKFFANSKLLDIYSSLDIMKKNCQKLDTFDYYKDVINEITKKISLIPLIEIITWVNIDKQDKKIILYLINEHLKNIFDTENIKDWMFVKERYDKSKIYRTRIDLLCNILKQIENFNIDTENPLEEAKKHIKKIKS